MKESWHVAEADPPCTSMWGCKSGGIHHAAMSVGRRPVQYSIEVTFCSKQCFAVHVLTDGDREKTAVFHEAESFNSAVSHGCCRFDFV